MTHGARELSQFPVRIGRCLHSQKGPWSAVTGLSSLLCPPWAPRSAARRLRPVLLPRNASPETRLCECANTEFAGYASQIWPR